MGRRRCALDGAVREHARAVGVEQQDALLHRGEDQIVAGTPFGLGPRPTARAARRRPRPRSARSTSPRSARARAQAAHDRGGDGPDRPRPPVSADREVASTVGVVEAAASNGTGHPAVHARGSRSPRVHWAPRVVHHRPVASPRPARIGHTKEETGCGDRRKWLVDARRGGWRSRSSPRPAAATTVATTGTTGASGRPRGLTGTITISGSSTVQPISSLVAELFDEDEPGRAGQRRRPGHQRRVRAVLRRGDRHQDASRPIEEEEIDACAKNGIEYVELEVALDGVTVMTNPANARRLPDDGDLYALFGPESEGFDNWSDADALAKQVGGTGGFPDAPLEITAPGEESGTYDAFIELAGIEDTAVEQGVPEDDSESLRKDYQASPDDNVIITAMEGTDSRARLRRIRVRRGRRRSGQGVRRWTAATAAWRRPRDTIADGTYPLSRSLYIYVNKDKLAENEALQAFVDLYVSDEGLKTRSRRSATSPSRPTASTPRVRPGAASGRGPVPRADHHGVGAGAVERRPRVSRRNVGGKLEQHGRRPRPRSRSRSRRCGAALAGAARSGSCAGRSSRRAALLSSWSALRSSWRWPARPSRSSSTSTSDGSWADGWFPRANEFDLLTIFAGTLMVAVIAMASPSPLGLGPPLYLSEYATPACPAHAEADPRDARQHPERRPGLLRAQGDQPRPGADVFGSTPAPSTSGRPGIAVGILIDPAGRVGRRGRDVRGAGRAARGRVRHRRPAPDRDHAGRVPGRRLRRSSPPLILGFSRAVGETMIVAIAAGATGGALAHLQPARPRADDDGRDLLARDRLGSGARVAGSRSTRSYFVGLLLFVITLALNVVCERFVRRVAEAY